MSGPSTLETPAGPEEIAEFARRPAFTGDVYRLAGGPLVCPVQHPCAMRAGIRLNPRILVCRVDRFNGGIPADWSTGHYKRMFLPGLIGGVDSAIEFVTLELVTPDDIAKAERVAILSERGVNLLLQRWTYHNNRIVVPTMTINEQMAGPFEEADLVCEASDELFEAGWAPEEVDAHLETWLSRSGADGRSQRDLLSNPQARSTVRRNLRSQLDSWLHAGQADGAL